MARGDAGGIVTAAQIAFYRRAGYRVPEHGIERAGSDAVAAGNALITIDIPGICFHRAFDGISGTRPGTGRRFALAADSDAVDSGKRIKQHPDTGFRRICTVGSMLSTGHDTVQTAGAGVGIWDDSPSHARIIKIRAIFVI